MTTTSSSRPSYHSHPAPTQLPGHTGQSPALAPAPASLPGQQSSFDYRYEFSETRKVLEEFFKAENEFPASSTVPSSQTRNSYTDTIHTVNMQHYTHGPQGISHVEPETDLDYSLTRLEV